MQSGCAVVNLPSFFKGYAGRVIEGMAAGCPVISWRIPDRPQTESLFTDTEEILLYNKDDPVDLARQIKRIQTETGLASHIVTTNRQKILRNHTIERRVEQILLWINKGEIPNYD
jgi:glycosyltransferase involved in cell wall biosynthesis